MMKNIARAKAFLAQKAQHAGMTMAIGLVGVAGGGSVMTRLHNGYRRRLSQAGVSSTVQEIGWLLLALILVAVVIIWATGAGKAWLNNGLGTASNVTPAGAVPAATIGG